MKWSELLGAGALAGDAVIGLTLAITGLRVLLLRRPFLMRGRVFTWLLAAGALSNVPPIAVTVWRAGFSLGSIELLVAAFLLTMIAIAVALIARMRGVIAFGMTAPVLRTALAAAAVRLDLQYIESLAELRFHGSDARIEIAVNGWFGSAQLRATTPDGRVVLGRLLPPLNGWLAATRTPVACLAACSHTMFGLALLWIVGFFLWS